MRNSSVLYLACAAMLSGCFVGDVSTVKESRMKGWPEFTVGQMLDKRQACTSTDWESFKDSRDRKIVQYTCVHGPGKEYLLGLNAKSLETEKERPQKDVDSDAESQARNKKALDEAYAKISRHEESIVEMQTILDNRKSDWERLQTVNASNCASLDYTQFKDPQVIKFFERLAERCANGAVEARGFTNEFLGTKERVSGWLKNMMSSVSDSLSRAQGPIAEGLKQDIVLIEQHQAKQQKQRESDAEGRESDRQARMALYELRASNFKEVREVSQWTVQDGTPVYLGSQVQLVFTDRTFDQKVDATFVFDHASRNEAGMTQLYELAVLSNWGRYNGKKS